MRSFQDIYNLSNTPIEGRDVAAFEEAPKPFFFSTSGVLRSPHTTGTNRTPLLRSSVLNLSAFCIASVTVSFFPARITLTTTSNHSSDSETQKAAKQSGDEKRLTGRTVSLSCTSSTTRLVDRRRGNRERVSSRVI